MKRFRDIEQLSGADKTVLAFLFAIYRGLTLGTSNFGSTRDNQLKALTPSTSVDRSECYGSRHYLWWIYIKDNDENHNICFSQLKGYNTGTASREWDLLESKGSWESTRNEHVSENQNLHPRDQGHVEKTLATMHLRRTAYDRYKSPHTTFYSHFLLTFCLGFNFLSHGSQVHFLLMHLVPK